MTVYVVEHNYDVDGGFGDAIPSIDIIAVFETENEANEFVKKYSNSHIYNEPYASLYCGRLEITPVEMGKYDESEFWWLNERRDWLDEDDEDE